VREGGAESPVGTTTPLDRLEHCKPLNTGYLSNDPILGHYLKLKISAGARRQVDFNDVVAVEQIFGLFWQVVLYTYQGGVKFQPVSCLLNKERLLRSKQTLFANKKHIHLECGIVALSAVQMANIIDQESPHRHEFYNFSK
jgi:hypothetical protein